MKQKLKIFAVCLCVCLCFGACFSLTGCISSQAVAYENKFGVSLQPYSDGDKYYADFIIAVRPSALLVSTTAFDNYLFGVFGSVLDTTRDKDNGDEQYELKDGNCYFFMYSCVIPNQHWFFKGDSGINVKYGAFNIAVDYDMPNPFSFAFQAGHPFYSICDILKNGKVLEFDSLDNFYSGFDLDDINTNVYLSTKSTAKTDSGEIAYDSANKAHYYVQNSTLRDTVDSDLVFSYTAVATYGWFGVVVVVGLIVAACILLFAKKKDGRVVDLNPIKVEEVPPTHVFGDFYNNNNSNDNDRFPPSGGASGGTGSGAGSTGVFEDF